MHRLLIHRSFTTPRWLEYLLVYLGVLVGMAGPFGMIRAHDMRDWHQRQVLCPRIRRMARGSGGMAGGSCIAAMTSTLRPGSRSSLTWRSPGSTALSRRPGWRSKCRWR